MNIGTARKSRNGQDVQTYFSPRTVSSTCLNILQVFSLCRPTDLGQAVWRQCCPVRQLVKLYMRYNVLEACNYESVKVERSVIGYLYYYLILSMSLFLFIFYYTQKTSISAKLICKRKLLLFLYKLNIYIYNISSPKPL